jgi:hypothetical protein
MEVLSRLGRINKDKADASWETSQVDFGALGNRDTAQFYRSACWAYRKAFELSNHYYPGGNAAVTGLLASLPEARDTAQAVACVCAAMNIGALPPDERYWVLATEGEMSLILGDSKSAADFFTQALHELPEGNDGVVQTTYHQLCRLYRALGPDRLQLVLNVFRKIDKFTLQRGVLGDCGEQFPPRAG